MLSQRYFHLLLKRRIVNAQKKRNVIPIKQENCIHKPPEFYHLVLERSILKWFWDQPFVINHSEWFHSPERSLLLKSFFLYIFFAYKAHVLYSGVPVFKTKRNTQEELIQNIKYKQNKICLWNVNFYLIKRRGNKESLFFNLCSRK